MIQHKAITLLLLLLPVLSLSARAQDTLTLSLRVGKVIDSTEQAYYRLFPDVEECRDMRFLRDGGEIRVMNGAEEVTSFTDKVLPILQTYLDEYNDLMEGKLSEKDADALESSYFPLTDAGITARIEKPQGMHLNVRYRTSEEGQVDEREGELLWADENILILRPRYERSVSRWSPIAVSDILSINARDASYATVGLLSGAAVGLVVGLASSSWNRGTSNSGVDTPDMAAVTLSTGLLMMAGGIIGAILGALIPAEAHDDIESQEDYRALLPRLQQNMYYRYGLPPDSPWREK